MYITKRLKLGSLYKNIHHQRLPFWEQIPYKLDASAKEYYVLPGEIILLTEYIVCKNYNAEYSKWFHNYKIIIPATYLEEHFTSFFEKVRQD